MRVIVAAGWVLGVAAVAGQTVDVGVVRDRLDVYLLAYEAQLGELVAEERLVQRDGPSA